MQRKRSKMVLLALGACSVGLTAWMLGVATGPASGQVKAAKAAKVTVITVTAGKPSEFAFKLSKLSAPAGTVSFKVTNKGAAIHDFKICTTAGKGVASANACTGKVTPKLKPGKSATLTVTLKKGKYEFLCDVTGHAKAGMKGVVGIGVAAPTPAPAPAPAPAPVPAPKPSGAACTNPVTTTVTVAMSEYKFVLSPGTFHCGTVTFVAQNTGAEPHNFDLQGTPIITPIIEGGSMSSTSGAVPPGSFSGVCDVPGHGALGMIIPVTVSNG
jgi:uncharacterized cupredoxin-like copper-binding protein